MVEIPRKPIRVMLVDDQPSFRQLAHRLLELNSAFEVVAETPSAEAALQEAAALQPDVVLMDIFMDGMNGLEGVRRFRDAFPHVRVLLISMYDDMSSLALEAGAVGFLPKREFSPEAVLARLPQALWSATPAR